MLIRFAVVASLPALLSRLSVNQFRNNQQQLKSVKVAADEFPGLLPKRQVTLPSKQSCLRCPLVCVRNEAGPQKATVRSIQSVLRLPANFNRSRLWLSSYPSPLPKLTSFFSVGAFLQALLSRLSVERSPPRESLSSVDPKQVEAFAHHVQTLVSFMAAFGSVPASGTSISGCSLQFRSS